MRVLIVHDHVPDSARQDEADALVQARAIADALESLGQEWMTLGLTLDLDAARAAIDRLNPDLIFNISESLGGFARLIHVPCGLFDALEIPYTGVGAEGMFLSSNKLVAKRLMRSSHIPTPHWHSLAEPPSASAFAPGQYIIKSVWEHASIGLDEGSVVHVDSWWQLSEGLRQRLDELGGEGFAEAYIEGREFNLAMLADETSPGDPEMLPPAEIVFEGYGAGKPRVVGYRAKWDARTYEYHHTPRRYDFAAADEPLLRQLRDLALQCWRAFDLRGWARVDFRVDGEGQPWALEVNANPCLSPDAGFAAALDRAGIDMPGAMARIVEDAMRGARLV